MASNAARTQDKKMEFKRVEFDANDIAPDAPEGEWQMSVPRGKCKIQPTKEDKFPMVIVPIRLDKTDEDGDEFQRALGTDLSVFLVFGGKNPRGERLNKLRIRQFCEALDIDLDIIPKVIESSDDLEPFVKAAEGKKFAGWTILNERKDTGEIVSEVRFTDPKRPLAAKGDDDDDDAPPSSRAPESEAQPRGRSKASSKANGRSKRR